MSPRRESKNRPKRKSTRKSRIPDVYVGEVVNTSVGPKKKVFFRIGGKAFFRMVDPDWKAPGRPMKQRAKSKEQRLEKRRGRE